MAKQRVLLDANVLYAYFMRDLLLSLFAEGHYEAKWTNRINGEWVEHLLENDPRTDRDRLQRTLDLMNAIQPSPLVTDYEHLIESLMLPDEKDRHVLAAAIASKVEKIVTWNIRDFPATVVSIFGIVVQTPDNFLHGLLIADPDGVVGVLRAMRLRLNRPALDVAAFFAALERNRLSRTRDALARYADLLR